MKPFKLPYESKVFQEKVSTEIMFQCNLGVSLTIQEAKEELYLKLLLASTELDEQAEHLRSK